MDTARFFVQSDKMLSPGDLRKAAQLLKSGQVVIFPTETVYGIGADALNPQAAQRIYEAKGRPSDNPLIVHISDRSQLFELVDEVPQVGQQLMEAFWPGPLTLIFKKSAAVPLATTGGLDSVAVRMPALAVARQLMEACARPLAAPSANLSGRPSITDPSYLEREFDGKVAALVLGTPSPLGLESTVADIRDGRVRILRPGFVTRQQIAAVVGSDRLCESSPASLSKRSPGTRYAHYQPDAQVVLVACAEKEGSAARILRQLRKDQALGLRSGAALWDQDLPERSDSILFGLGDSLEEAARHLFSALRKADLARLQILYIPAIKKEGLGEALMNRLERASKGQWLE